LKYLLDTHTLIWYATDAPQLSATARALIEDPNNDILISPASIWEIAIKVSIGKLALPVEPSHTTIVSSLPFPPRHKDPFDRLLIAQAIIESIPIVSVDLAFDSYAVQRIW
jgi:PIN domain nuclease of toxin-antitoxin system